MDFAALVALAFVASITPGPNNLMLLGAGMNHGIRRTLPHLAGVSLGFAFLIFLVAVGLGTIFEQYEPVEYVLKLLGGSYLAYLAWKIFNTRSVADARQSSVPMTLVQAAMFQWVNPKAWVMATTASGTLLDTNSSVSVGAAKLTLGFWIINLPCISTWMLSGVFASRWVDSDQQVRTINRALGILLAGTVVWLMW